MELKKPEAGKLEAEELGAAEFANERLWGVSREVLKKTVFFNAKNVMQLYSLGSSTRVRFFRAKINCENDSLGRMEAWKLRSFRVWELVGL